LSTLTKVLIVLQTLFTIALCATVVVYVANADNYKKLNENAQRSLRAARTDQQRAEQEKEEYIAAKDAEFKQAGEQIQSLTDQVTTLGSQLAQTETEKKQLEQSVVRMSTTAESANRSAEQQAKLYEAEHERFKNLESEQIRLKKEYDETQGLLIEKLAIISDQTQKIRQLEEEKSELLAKSDQYLNQYGRTAPDLTPVTPGQSSAQLAVLNAKKLNLNGRISDIDVKSRLAEISVGAVDGVKEEMKFMVTRGDQFVCNILVLAVDANKSVGVLELIQDIPQVGDKVSTNF